MNNQQILDSLQPCPACGKKAGIALTSQVGVGYVEHIKCFKGPEVVRRMGMTELELEEAAAQAWNELKR